MSHLQYYTKSYYQEIQAGSVSSAEVLVPFIKDLIQPQSIVDVGCGTGIWLKEWEKKGITDYLGLDGEYIKDDQLVIPKEKFLQINLDHNFKLPRNYDLVLCLEVAEHIQPTSAELFINSLCKLGNVILFSAAIPGQGGLNHLNEQYQDYWVKIFEQNGFSPYDFIRQKVWLNEKIEACYRQNILFFIHDGVKQKYPAITSNASPLLPIIHPYYYEDKKLEAESLKKILKNPFRIFIFYVRAIGRLLKLIK